MENLKNDLVAIVLQHLNDNNYHEAARSLEQESGIFFNIKYFEEKVIAGEWEDLEKYLLGFTEINANRFSMKMFFELRRQKYLEALYRNEKDRAVGILRDDLKVFSLYDEDLYKELSHLLTVENFREHANLRNYVDAQTSRIKLVISVKELIKSNPNFRRKLDFPSFGSARLINLLNQSVNMQHSLCVNRGEIPEIETLLTDHECKPVNMASTSSAVPADTVTNRNASPSLGLDSVAGSSVAAAIYVEDSDEENRHASTRSVTHVVGSSVASAINVEDSDEEDRHASMRSATHCDDESKAISNEWPIPSDGVQVKNKPWQLSKITNLDQSSKLPYHSLTMQQERGDVAYPQTIAAHCKRGTSLLSS